MTTQPITQPFFGGWHPSLPDGRDQVYQLPTGVSLPSSVDWRNGYLPAILDQGSLGSCTAFAGKYAFQYASFFQSLGALVPEDISELFQYYYERVIEHSVTTDAGASMRDVFKTMKKYGVCKELLWPYITTKFDVKPSILARQDASTSKVKKYERVSQQHLALETCLASHKVFVIGISVYDSFLTAHVAQTGNVPMPDLTVETLQGGHALCIVGYENTNSIYYAVNSWGEQWGDAGCLTIPQAYLEDPNLAGDIWTLDTM